MAMTASELIRKLLQEPANAMVEIVRPFDLELGPGDTAPVAKVERVGGAVLISGGK